MALSDLEGVGTGDTATQLRDTLGAEDVRDRGESLAHLAVDVEHGGDGKKILGLDLTLGPEGWDVELLKDVGRSVEGDDEGLEGVVALVVLGVVGQALGDVKDHTGAGVELRVVLADEGAGADLSEAEALSAGHHVVVSLLGVGTVGHSKRFDLSSNTVLVGVGGDVGLDIGSGGGPVLVEVGLGEGLPKAEVSGHGARGHQGKSESGSHFFFVSLNQL